MICLLTIKIYWNAASSIIPSNKSTPGTADVDSLYEEFINVDKDIAYRNVLEDLSLAVKKTVDENDKRTRTINSIVSWFQVQIVFVAVYILVPVVESFI